jgi:hypothetical protein
VGDNLYLLLTITKPVMHSDDMTVCRKSPASGSVMRLDKKPVIPQIISSAIIAPISLVVWVTGLAIRSSAEACESASV